MKVTRRTAGIGRDRRGAFTCDKEQDGNGSAPSARSTVPSTVSATGRK